MPEAAEVRHVGDMLETASGRVIREAFIVSGRYSRKEFDLSKLTGATIERILVKGKLIVFALRKDGEVFGVLSTLGMTGWWYRAPKNDPAPRHTRLKIVLDDDSALTYADQRNFGTFKIASWAMVRAKQAELGPDIMTPRRLWSITLPDFFARVERYGKKQTVAEALLDQRIAAGVGNYIRADAMYLGAFSPFRLVSNLSRQELTQLWQMVFTIATCAYNDVHPTITNTGYSNLCYGQKTSPKGGTIEAVEDKNGRTVWYCPSEQGA